MTKIQLDVSQCSGDIQKRLNYISPSGISTVFSDDFMQANTNHKTFAEFCTAIGCNILTDKDNLESGNLDSVIKEHSRFTSWGKMLESAYQALADEK